ncbi:unnamed protein product [Gulo gulo]|uniref:Uncharacterized protein n=1 Tax=Gulo gulo TaxID=48420 RepID=A0A9X9LES6_GULGU|nr:unnamed protein product [Gulo gulo]
MGPSARGAQSPLATGCAGFSGRVLSPHNPPSPAGVSTQPCGRLAPCAAASQPLLLVLSQSDPLWDSHMWRNVLGTPKRPQFLWERCFPAVVPADTPPTPTRHPARLGHQPDANNARGTESNTGKKRRGVWGLF